MDTPHDHSEKVMFAHKLMKFGVSVTEYSDALNQTFSVFDTLMSI